MTTPIPLRDFVVSGLVEEATVNALLAFGEPMVSETVVGRTYANPNIRTTRQYRAWIRYRPGCAGGRVFGPRHSTPQFAATALLEKLVK